MSFLLWLLYMLGELAHVLKQASTSVSSTVSPVTSIKEWFQRNWPAVVVRLVICQSLFLFWATPWLDKVLPLVGMKALVGLLPAPTRVSPETSLIALMSGFFADSIIDWVSTKFWPIAQKEIPAYTAQPKETKS